MRARLLAVAVVVLTSACGHDGPKPSPDAGMRPPPACDQQALAQRFGSDTLNFQPCGVKALVEMFGKEARAAYVDCQGFEALTGTWQTRVKNWEKLVTALKDQADQQVANAADIAKDLVELAVIPANRAHREDMVDRQLLKKIVDRLEKAADVPGTPFPDCQVARRNGSSPVAVSCAAAGVPG